MLFIEKTRSWSKKARILIYAYSTWFGSYLPLLSLLIPEVLYGVYGVETSPLLWWVLAFACATLMPILRVRKQPRTLPDVE